MACYVAAYLTPTSLSGFPSLHVSTPPWKCLHQNGTCHRALTRGKLMSSRSAEQFWDTYCSGAVVMSISSLCSSTQLQTFREQQSLSLHLPPVAMGFSCGQEGPSSATATSPTQMVFLVAFRPCVRCVSWKPRKEATSPCHSSHVAALEVDRNQVHHNQCPKAGMFCLTWPLWVRSSCPP
jgi:hypothetical protein